MENIIGDIQKLNTTQKLVLALAISLVTLVGLAHNPFSGYQTKIVTEDYYDKPLPECTDEEKDEYRAFLIGMAKLKRYPEFGRITDFGPMVSKCHRLRPGIFTTIATTPEKIVTTTDIPFSQWSSNAPMINWFGFIVNSILSLVAITIISSVFFVIFFNRTPEQ